MITLATIELPEFIWLNRGNWSPHRLTVEHALDGSMHVEVGTVQAGRPMVIYGDSASAALYSSLDTHQAAQGAQSFTLSIDGTDFTVMWDYRSELPVTGTPTVNFSDSAPDAWDSVTLRLMTV